MTSTKNEHFEIHYIDIDEPENCEFCGCIMGRGSDAIELEFEDGSFYFCSEECAGDYKRDTD